MNKKYLIYSFIFIASLSLHSFADHHDHHDHFSFEDEHSAECQACEENVEIKIAISKDVKNSQNHSIKANLTSRFVDFNPKSNLSRAPPLFS